MIPMLVGPLAFDFDAFVARSHVPDPIFELLPFDRSDVIDPAATPFGEYAQVRTGGDRPVLLGEAIEHLATRLRKRLEFLGWTAVIRTARNVVRESITEGCPVRSYANMRTAIALGWREVHWAVQDHQGERVVFDGGYYEDDGETFRLLIPDGVVMIVADPDQLPVGSFTFTRSPAIPDMAAGPYVELTAGEPPCVTLHSAARVEITAPDRLFIRRVAMG
jgi:hypothetical protein